MPTGKQQLSQGVQRDQAQRSGFSHLKPLTSQSHKSGPKRENKPVDSFITALYALAEHYSYGVLHDELLWWLVVVLRDSRLSKRM